MSQIKQLAKIVAVLSAIALAGEYVCYRATGSVWPRLQQPAESTAHDQAIHMSGSKSSIVASPLDFEQTPQPFAESSAEVEPSAQPNATAAAPPQRRRRALMPGPKSSSDLSEVFITEPDDAGRDDVATANSPPADQAYKPKPVKPRTRGFSSTKSAGIISPEDIPRSEAPNGPPRNRDSDPFGSSKGRIILKPEDVRRPNAPARRSTSQQAAQQQAAPRQLQQQANQPQQR